MSFYCNQSYFCWQYFCVLLWLFDASVHVISSVTRISVPGQLQTMVRRSNWWIGLSLLSPLSHTRILSQPLSTTSHCFIQLNIDVGRHLTLIFMNECLFSPLTLENSPCSLQFSFDKILWQYILHHESGGNQENCAQETDTWWSLLSSSKLSWDHPQWSQDLRREQTALDWLQDRDEDQCSNIQGEGGVGQEEIFRLQGTIKIIIFAGKCMTCCEGTDSEALASWWIYLTYSY